MLRTFSKFLAEETQKPKIDTTGHLTHAGDLLYQGDPSHAIHHFEKMRDRINNVEDENHPISLKIDGGMSFIMGKDEDNRSFVSYKSGKKRFYDTTSIRATGKKHYEKLLVPALYATMKMKKMKPGTAIQADSLYVDKPKKDSFSSNTVEYMTPSEQASFAFAPHSQYEVRGNAMNKLPDDPDHSLIKTNRVFAPELTLQGKQFNEPEEEINSELQKNIGGAKMILDDEELQSFAADLPLNKKLHTALQSYSDHSTRTTGERSTSDFGAFLLKHMGKRRVSARLKKEELESHMATIGDNKHHFDSLFGAHNMLTNAKNIMLDHLAGHNHLFNIQPHRDHEHEGLVATSGETGTMAKFVREGPNGFSAKNQERSLALGKSRSS